ncbi:MAG: flagellar biosynthetic protein FliR [Proteobacteria bacterium]|nr:MAG: flagellar biosynthetic protein FliR [Pseudomonadota bacterium]
MGLYGFNETQIIAFFASLVRVSFLLMLLPIFGDNVIPATVKIFLSFTINLIVFPVATSVGIGQVAAMASTDMGMAGLVVREACVGGIIGFIGKIFFDSLSFAFGHMGNQMGFNMAASYDHHSESSIPVISNMIMILATLLFLALDGHHLFLKAIVQSYQLIPLGGFVFSKAVVAYVLDTSSQIFWIACKLSAPMALMIFLINCAFGIVSKAVPQINVLVVSFTVNILAGFLVIALTLPVFGSSVSEVFVMMMDRMMHVIGMLA